MKREFQTIINFFEPAQFSIKNENNDKKYKYDNPEKIMGEISFPQLLSGLIGSLCGVLITLILYWDSRRTTTKRTLADRLLILRHDVHWSCTDADVFKTWDASLKKLRILFNAYYEFAPCWRRHRITKAWIEYKGEKDYSPDSKMFPKSKEAFKHNITSFLKAL